MGIIHGNLTHGELIQVFGRALEDIGERMHDGDFEDGIQIQEVIDIVTSIASDAYQEWQDTD